MSDMIVQKLRRLMRENQLDAYIIPNTDPHQSEYFADHWKFQRYVSGFTGSAGNLVITSDFAGLWTDSRYFIQAENELKGSCISLMKLKVAHSPEYIDWLKENLKSESRIGLNTELFSANLFRQLDYDMFESSIELIDIDLISLIWDEQPILPKNPVSEHFLTYCGLSRNDKIEAVRSELKKNECQWTFISSLDDIAWLFNLRGEDVAYNPVFISNLLLGIDKINFFVDESKLSEEVRIALEGDGITIYPYSYTASQLSKLPFADLILIDDSKVNQKLYSSLPDDMEVLISRNITTDMKAIKNDVEIRNIGQTMIKDGIALVRFLKWLEENIGQEPISELSAAAKLLSFRAEQEDFKGESFSTIAAYKEHGAIAHYFPSSSTDKTLEQESFFLLDSGGQYLGGTTDITRTISLGELSEQQCKDYTLVLKSHINLAMAIFPEGTTGVQLDTIPRKPMWEAGVGYGHGTGHGVGFYLNVHEGPQAFGKGKTADSSVSFQVGMLTSNEPGIYREGEYGIRIENLILTVPHMENEYGKFFRFETVSLCPIDTSPISLELLTDNEIDWLNEYHRKVFETLSPFLEDVEADWLKSKTGVVSRL